MTATIDATATVDTSAPVDTMTPNVKAKKGSPDPFQELLGNVRDDNLPLGGMGAECRRVEASLLELPR